MHSNYRLMQWHESARTRYFPKGQVPDVVCPVYVELVAELEVH